MLSLKKGKSAVSKLKSFNTITHPRMGFWSSLYKLAALKGKKTPRQTKGRRSSQDGSKYSDHTESIAILRRPPQVRGWGIVSALLVRSPAPNAGWRGCDCNVLQLGVAAGPGSWYEYGEEVGDGATRAEHMCCGDG